MAIRAIPSAIYTMISCSILSWPTIANTIPLGININTGIFIQESIDNTGSTFCVANTLTNEETIIVSNWPKGSQNGDKKSEWVVQGKSTTCFTLDDFLNNRILNFSLKNGTLLGLLSPSKIKSTHNERQIKKQGINGTCTSRTAWTEEVLLPNNIPAIELHTTDRDAVFEFAIATKIPLPQLPITNKLLTFTEVETAPNKPQIYKATLNYVFPAVSTPSMFIISGRKKIKNSGWECFARGVVIQP